MKVRDVMTTPVVTVVIASVHPLQTTTTSNSSGSASAKELVSING